MWVSPRMFRETNEKGLGPSLFSVSEAEACPVPVVWASQELLLLLLLLLC